MNQVGGVYKHPINIFSLLDSEHILLLILCVPLVETTMFGKYIASNTTTAASNLKENSEFTLLLVRKLATPTESHAFVHNILVKSTPRTIMATSNFSVSQFWLPAVPTALQDLSHTVTWFVVDLNQRNCPDHPPWGWREQASTKRSGNVEWQRDPQHQAALVSLRELLCSSALLKLSILSPVISTSETEKSWARGVYPEAAMGLCTALQSILAARVCRMTLLPFSQWLLQGYLFQKTELSFKREVLTFFSSAFAPFFEAVLFVSFSLLSWLGRLGWDKMEAAGAVPKGSLISSCLFQQFRGNQPTLAEVKHKTRKRRFFFMQQGVMWGAPCQGPSPVLTELAGLGKMVRQRRAGSTTCIGVLPGLGLSCCGWLESGRATRRLHPTFASSSSLTKGSTFCYSQRHNISDPIWRHYFLLA